MIGCQSGEWATQREQTEVNRMIRTSRNYMNLVVVCVESRRKHSMIGCEFSGPLCSSCRYLRLSESNISTLLQLCKESGVDVDIHPHMKDSDIDIATLFKSSSSSLDNTELI